MPERYDLVDDMAAVPTGSVDVVCCFEALEHLYDDEITAFAGQAQRVLAPGGEMTVSVPVIGGPTLLLKEANRAILFRRRSDYSVGELLAASFAGPVGAAAGRHQGHPQGLRLPPPARSARRAVRGGRAVVHARSRACRGGSTPRSSPAFAPT